MKLINILFISGGVIITLLALFFWKTIIFIFLHIVASFSGMEWVGDSHSGFKESSEAMSPEEAIELAEPHLDKTLALQREKRENIYELVKDYVFKKGRVYYVIRDDYPFKNPTFELQTSAKSNGVQVHIDTKEVTLPS